MFVSTHYGGEDLVIKFGKGEAWKKVFGPVFIYLNSTSDGTNAASLLWGDAKTQVIIQTTSSKTKFCYESNHSESKTLKCYIHFF